MLALAPTQLPATADASSVARSVAALERNQPEAARVAYGTALQRWPQQATLLFGLGNSHYALHDLPAAARAYQAAVLAQPDYADAWNNLAQVQWELGLPDAARSSIAQAVALGGGRLAQYQKLQAEIEAAPAHNGDTRSN
jgi:tetratricopeptide (TPR) repeat protein